MASDALKLMDLLPAARLFDEEAADALASACAAHGARVKVTGPGTAGGFDVSLGAVGATSGWLVMVHKDDVARLVSALADEVEPDEDDPVREASRAWCEALLAGPLDGNLLAMAMAKRRLRQMPADAPDAVVRSIDDDPYWDADCRMAAGLGSVGAVLALRGVLVLVGGVLPTHDPAADVGSAGSELVAMAADPVDPSDGITLPRLFFSLLAVPLLFVVLVSRRQLTPVSSRWRYPRTWRVVAGGSLLLLVVAALGIIVSGLIHGVLTP